MRRRGDASSTAEGVAWLRAVGARERDAALRNPDHLAHELLQRRFRMTRHVPGGWRTMRRVWETFVPGYYEYEIARTKYIDGVLLDEVATGIDQLVLVGSGYDSRFYRFAEQLADVRKFELDRDVTLERKRRRAAKRGLGDGGAAQVPLDLNLATPLEALRRHGYEDGARTLFVCSGVLMYVDPVAVDRLLAFVGGAGAGTSICFDYVYAGAVERPGDYHGARQIIRKVEQSGEPYRFTVDERDLPALLARHGLALVSEAGPRALERAYVRRADGSVRGRICDYIALAHARRASAPSAPA